MIFDKRFELLDASDLQDLVSTETREGTRLDYKESLPADSDSGKKDFLADVASFANSSGGFIIYGVTEKRDASGQPTGIPESIGGITNLNFDKEELRLHQIIRSSIDPRPFGITARQIDGFANGPALILSIPKSLNAPHLVTYQGSSRFYGRTSAGKHQLDVREIRSLFLESSTLPEKIREFQSLRLSRILSKDTPIRLGGEPIHLLHVIPLGTFAGNAPFDISGIEKYKTVLRPPGATSWSGRFNIDGYVATTAKDENGESMSYLQVFRTGVLEIVTSREDFIRNDKKYIPATGYERDTIEDAIQALNFYSDADVQPPFLFMPSIIGLKDAVFLTWDNEYGGDSLYPFNETNLLLPDVTLHESDQDIARVLRPSFDVLWQAGGFSCSRNYDKDGNWRRGK